MAVAPAALGTRRLSGSRIQNGRAVHLLVSLPPEYGFNPSEVRVASSSFHRLARMRGASKIRDENFADFSGANLLRTEQQPFGMLIKKCCLASTTSSFEFRHYLSFASNGG